MNEESQRRATRRHPIIIELPTNQYLCILSVPVLKYNAQTWSLTEAQEPKFKDILDSIAIKLVA